MGVIALPDGTRVKRSASVFEPGYSKSHPNPDQTPAALAAATANAQAKEAARLLSWRTAASTGTRARQAA